MPKENYTFIKITEQNSLHKDLDKKSVRELLYEMNEEDRKVPLAVAEVIPQIEFLINKIVERMIKGGRVFYIGAGTSGRLGVLDSSEVPPTFGISNDKVIGLIAGGDIALRQAVENAEDDMESGWRELKKLNVNANDTIIGIAASGSTPYVIGALRNARMNGILTASITCNQNSPVAGESEISIEVVVGPELITGSTRLKSGTAQKLILNMISTTVMIKLGRVKGNKMINLQPVNKKLVERGIRLIMEETGVEYEKAKTMLLNHGSVKNAIEEYRK